MISNGKWKLNQFDYILDTLVSYKLWDINTIPFCKCNATVRPKRLGQRVTSVHEVLGNASNTSTKRPQHVRECFER